MCFLCARFVYPLCIPLSTLCAPFVYPVCACWYTLCVLSECPMCPLSLYFSDILSGRERMGRTKKSQKNKTEPFVEDTSCSYIYCIRLCSIHFYCTLLTYTSDFFPCTTFSYIYFSSTKLCYSCHYSSIPESSFDILISLVFFTSHFSQWRPAPTTIAVTPIISRLDYRDNARWGRPPRS